MTTELHLVRDEAGDDCQFGILACPEQSFHTLEDTVREIEGEPVETWKIPGQTAIPRGRYQVLWTFSNHFKEYLPLLVDVPGFSGVRIHSGNVASDTEGCVLLGMGRAVNSISSSRIACSRFNAALLAYLSVGDVWLTVE